jgi:PadR family transcriptional regulator PadR
MVERLRNGIIDIHSIYMHCNPMLRKELVAASAEPLILSLLANGESYGYAIIQEIRARSQSRMEWTDGMLYPVLHRLERKRQIKARWVEAESGRKRKYYSLRGDGRKALEEHREHWAIVHSVLAGFKKEQYV